MGTGLGATTPTGMNEIKSALAARHAHMNKPTLDLITKNGDGSKVQFKEEPLATEVWVAAAIAGIKPETPVNTDLGSITLDHDELGVLLSQTVKAPDGSVYYIMSFEYDVDGSVSATVKTDSQFITRSTYTYGTVAGEKTLIEIVTSQSPNM